MLAVSAVQYARGLHLELVALGAFAWSRGILFCVDAIQQLGALRFDARACQADFVAADGYKWILGPEGGNIEISKLRNCWILLFSGI